MSESILKRIPRFGILIITSLAAAVGIALFGNSAGAQSTNWFINFDVPGGAAKNGWTNYFGPGAYTNTVSYVVTTNGSGSLITNVVNDGYYWNPVADNATNSGSLMVLGDGTTASSPIVLSNMDLYGAPGYSPIGTGQGAGYANYGNFWALFLPYQHDGGNTTGPLQLETNILYNVPPGTYNLYLYGMNGDPAINTDYADSQCDRGTTFKVWSDLTPNKILSDVNATNSGFFARGVNYVRANNVVTSNGVIYVSYAANTTVYAKYNGSTTLVQNHEGDFDGLQLVFVSTNTTPIPSPVTLTNMYPNGDSQFQSSPTLSFNALSTNGIATNQISISLSATILGGQSLQDVGEVVTTNLTYSTGGITVSGDLVGFTNLLVSTPLMTNALYSVTITVSDLSGNSQTVAFTFDTISASYDYVF